MVRVAWQSCSSASDGNRVPEVGSLHVARGTARRGAVNRVTIVLIVVVLVQATLILLEPTMKLMMLVLIMRMKMMMIVTMMRTARQVGVVGDGEGT